MSMIQKQKEKFMQDAGQIADALIDYAQTHGKSAGLSDVEIYISGHNETSVSVEDGEPAMTENGAVDEITIKLFAGDRKIAFSRNIGNLDQIKKAISDNLQLLPHVPENPDTRLAASEDVAQAMKEDLDLFDADDVTSQDLIAYALKVEKEVYANKQVKSCRSVSASQNVSMVYHKATNGIERALARTKYSAGASVIAEANEKMEIGGEYYGARHFKDMPDAKLLGRDAANDAVSKLGSEQPETGDYPIVLDHGTAAGFFSTVMSAISGNAVYQNATILKDSLGQSVMPKDITIEDDPSLERGLGSQSVDSAGIASQKMTFIEKGVVKSYVLNLHSARKLKQKPIGRESGLTNTRVQPGTQTPESLIKNIKKGILIKGFNGGTVNLQNGTYSRPAYGVMIEDGKITDKPVSGFIVAGDLKEAFQNVSIANDTPSQPDSKYRFAAPTTRIDGMTVSGK
tara:strand:+ start:123 stop:1493 length:1371 start_codon:yes stop_codon:yes gene_type:complete